MFQICEDTGTGASCTAKLHSAPLGADAVACSVAEKQASEKNKTHPFILGTQEPSPPPSRFRREESYNQRLKPRKRAKPAQKRQAGQAIHTRESADSSKDTRRTGTEQKKQTSVENKKAIKKSGIPSARDDLSTELRPPPRGSQPNA